MWAKILLFTVLTSGAEVLGSTQNLYFDSSCDDTNYYTIYEDDTYYIRWKGVKPSGLYSNTCSYKFSPFDTDYKVCVEAQNFNINDCSIKLKYWGGIIAGLLRKTYSCFDSTPDKFCGDTFDDVKVQLSSSSSSKSSADGSFTLKVTTKNSYQASIVAGAVVGGVVFSIIVVSVIIVVCRRRRLYPGSVVVGQQQGQVVTSTATSAYSGGYVNQNYAAPPPYPGQPNSTGNMNSYPPPPTNTYPHSGYNTAQQYGIGGNAPQYPSPGYTTTG